MIQLAIPTNPPKGYCLVYDYYGSSPSSCEVPSPGTNNNGNVMGYWYQDASYPTLSHTATFTYDIVNRLTSGVATGNWTYNLTFSYTQDGTTGLYGNMSCVINGQTNGPCLNVSFNRVNNHISTSGFTYDAAGNLLTDPGNTPMNTYQWDAEERVRKVTQNGSTVSSDTYNADGQAVETSWPGYNLTGDNIFDPWGQELGHYDVTGGYWWDRDIRLGGRIIAQSFPSDTYFLHANNLGSDTQVTDHSGAVQTDFVYYPWQIATSLGTVVDAHFAGFQQSAGPTYGTPTRTYTGPQGRWFTPDPAGKAASRLDDPQTWNMYAYVRNNPTTLTDPTGLFVQCSSNLGKKDMATCVAIQDAAYAKDKNGNWRYQKLHDIYTKLNDDERVWTIQKATLSRGTLGVTTLQGTNAMGTDFTAGTIKMDFNQIRGLSAPSPADKVSGFSMYAGITGNKTLKILENFGHEGAHGVWALGNTSLAVTEQNLANSLGLMGPGDPNRVPAFNVMRFIDNFTETYAQQQEQIVNEELNANP